jgi:hypothetical protein
LRRHSLGFCVRVCARLQYGWKLVSCPDVVCVRVGVFSWQLGLVGWGCELQFSIMRRRLHVFGRQLLSCIEHNIGWNRVPSRVLLHRGRDGANGVQHGWVLVPGRLVFSDRIAVLAGELRHDWRCEHIQ